MPSENDIEEIPADSPVDITFAELGLDPKILKALNDMGYVNPTPIQAQAIPHAMKMRDVLGIAQTGTGKTGAFVLPTMHKLSKGRARARMPRCLIICPTRELAAQVAENVEQYSKYLKLEMALLIGGVSFGDQDKKLMKGVDILIATPGRLLDQFERGKILMTGVTTLVVDEADRMLDMGFIPDIERIFKMTPFTRQVLFFSATMPNEIKRLVDQFLHQPATIQVARQSTTAETVTQRIVRMPSSDSKQKRTALRWIIDHEDVDNGIVFCNRKKDVDIVAKSLTKHGHSAAPIHGDLPQSERTKTLEAFKSGKIKMLVASDVAARGLDVPSVSHVFNFDVPTHSEDYVHRIGRTGRAGREGDAIMLVSRLDEKYYDQILDLIKVKAIDELEIPGLEDFPTGGRGRKGHKDKNNKSKDNKFKDNKSKGRGRSKERNEGEPPKARKDAPKRSEKNNPLNDTKETDTEATASRPKTARRAAPKRKDTDIEKNKNNVKSKRSDAKKKSVDKKESNTEIINSDNHRARSKERNAERDGTVQAKHRHANKMPENKKAGFGENVPAFFNSSLKG